jgi:sarcosine oxidase, subunit gamma
MAELTRLAHAPMIAVRCRPADLGVLAIALPTTANRFQVAGGWTAIWMSPDEWLLIDEGGGAIERFEAAAVGHDIAVVDVSGNRVGYRLDGEGAAAMLAKGCSLDLDGFAVGQCASTMLARAQVVLLKRSDAQVFDIYPRRSFAHYLESWFDAACQ